MTFRVRRRRIAGISAEKEQWNGTKNRRKTRPLERLSSEFKVTGIIVLDKMVTLRQGWIYDNQGEQVVSMRCPANLWRWVCSQGPGRHQELNWTTFKKPFAFWFNRVRAAASSSWKDRILKWRRRSRDLKLGSNSSPPPLLNLTFQRRRRNKNIFSCRGDLGMEHFSGWIGW